ncbi:MAG: AmmeMemoRadiSam system protein B [Desulfobulbus propionicus]|nr:MAG: AmmeMemoRadiSam system protein B [Desulfobulbus propionicus]
MVRQPAVADRFYPADPEILTSTLRKLLPVQPGKKRKAIAAIVPHAGYVYSGSTAGATLAGLDIPETVMLLGPNHYGQGATLGLGIQPWRTPLGEVQVDTGLADLVLAGAPLVTVDETAHHREHSLEVQIPFLQLLRPEVKILPLVVSSLTYGSCHEVGRQLARAIRGHNREVLVLASTDMTHYEPRAQAQHKDQAALKYILRLDASGLFATVHADHISMCGVIPATITLDAAIALGATGAELVRYTDSGEISGDTARVVGYAGLVIT